MRQLSNTFVFDVYDSVRDLPGSNKARQLIVKTGLHYLDNLDSKMEAIRALARKLGRPESLRACYEAGPTGYVVYWQLTALGVRCEVVAPTLVPVQPNETVLTTHVEVIAAQTKPPR